MKLMAGEMLLKLEMFHVVEANWDSKADSIIRIASTIGIGPKALLYR